MYKLCSVVWIITITTSKSCVNSFGLPFFNLKSVLPQGDSTVITKPLQYLYNGSNRILNHTLNKALPKPAVNFLELVNPLNLPSHLRGVLNYNQRTTPSQVSAEISKYQRLEWTTPTNFMSPENSERNKRSTNADMVVNLSKQNGYAPNSDDLFNILDQLDRKFYQASYEKLLSISPQERKENGISFAQSNLFFYLQLIALCEESDADTKAQIKLLLGLKGTCAKQAEELKNLMASLPTSNESLKFRWSSRLVLSPQLKVSNDFISNTVPSLYIHLNQSNEFLDSKGLTKMLNQMVEKDSGGAMPNTFEEEELGMGICAVWLTTIYLRPRWRSAPTVLNGTREFYDGDAPPSSVRMIRINDVMQYAFLPECNAEAIEIQYAQAGLSFLIMLPRERSLKRLANCALAHNLQHVYREMRTTRIAVTLPIYTLRMTLLLPGKLEMLGVPMLVTSGGNCETLKLSHGVQRIMFWAEAGRNAFKDDGIEWDDTPEFEKIVDRPYKFYVRWHNLTLLNGNFVL